MARTRMHIKIELPRPLKHLLCPTPTKRALALAPANDKIILPRRDHRGALESARVQIERLQRQELDRGEGLRDALRVLGGRNLVVGLLKECVDVRVDVAEAEVAGVAVVPLGGLLVGDA